MGGGGGGGGGGHGWRPGDWECPACHGHNFASRARCYQCAADRPAGAGGPPPAGWGPPGGAPVPNWKPGDWMCGGCNTHNFASRAACFRCGAAKEGGGAPGGPP